MSEIDWVKVMIAFEEGSLDIDKGAETLEKVLKDGGSTAEAFMASIKRMLDELEDGT